MAMTEKDNVIKMCQEENPDSAEIIDNLLKMVQGFVILHQ